MHAYICIAKLRIHQLQVNSAYIFCIHLVACMHQWNNQWCSKRAFFFFIMNAYISLQACCWAFVCLHMHYRYTFTTQCCLYEADMAKYGTLFSVKDTKVHWSSIKQLLLWRSLWQRLITTPTLCPYLNSLAWNKCLSVPPPEGSTAAWLMANGGKTFLLAVSFGSADSSLHCTLLCLHVYTRAHHWVSRSISDIYKDVGIIFPPLRLMKMQ